MQDEYFANLSGDELAGELNRRVSNYYDQIETNGRIRLWRKSYRAYYSLNEWHHHEAAEIERGGRQGELSMLKANHYRNLLTHLLVLVTQQRPSFECRSVNTDYKSQVQTILGNNILEYYLREKRLEEHFKQAAELALLYGEAYMSVEWDRFLGEEAIQDEDGSYIKTGEIVANVYEPFNVIRQIQSDADTRQNWYITRTLVSRHDLAAKYPDQTDVLLTQDVEETTHRVIQYMSTEFEAKDEDLIPVYTFYHDKTPACPDGRYAKFVGDTLLEAGRLPYKDLPIIRMRAHPQYGTSFGYTIAFDLLCVQEAIDLLYSTILSNQAAFGVQNIWVKPGTNLTPQQMGGGLNVFESMEKPEAINLTNTPPEIFKFLQGVENLGEVLSGVNSVARGQPDASLKSGTALALVASQAVQFSNGIQSAYTRLVEDVGTAILRTLQQKATLPRTAAISGEDNKAYVREFVGEDIDTINRVVVDMGNPISRTLGGRVQMAQDMLQQGLLKRPEQYFEVVSSGRLKPLIEDEQAEHLLIRAENEALREGRPVMATAIDHHVQHIKGHRAVIADPDTRAQPELIERALSHIQEHIEALKNVDPALLNLLGMNAILPPQPPGPPPGGPAPGGPPPEGNPNQMEAPPNTPPEVAENMPDMPTVTADPLATAQEN